MCARSHSASVRIPKDQGAWRAAPMQSYSGASMSKPVQAPVGLWAGHAWNNLGHRKRRGTPRT
eukprot:4308536-Pyramimonas_sp.AAC.1